MVEFVSSLPSCWIKTSLYPSLLARCSAISGAYSHLSREQREQMGIRAHDTRGVATTWAATIGVPFEDIMDAAAWSRPQTFARFYLKDLPAMRGRFSRAVMVVAGTAARK